MRKMYSRPSHRSRQLLECVMRSADDDLSLVVYREERKNVKLFFVGYKLVDASIL